MICRLFTGELLDVSASKSRAIEARILADWILDVAASADRLHRAIQAEPQGEIIDTALIRSVLARALSAFEEQAMLDKMARTMRTALQSEPQGGLMDTSELLKQRAQIKVCSQCGREL